MFIFLKRLIERKRERTGVEGRRQRETEKESLRQTLGWVRIPTQGSISPSWGHDLSQNQESDAQRTDPLSHPRTTYLDSV